MALEKILGGEAWERIINEIRANIQDVRQRQQFLDTLTLALAAALGSNDELDGIGSRISASAVSGVGASDVGVAGSLALSVVNGKTEATVSDDQDGTMTMADTEESVITISANGAQTVYTTAGSSLDYKGSFDKIKPAAAGATNGGANGSAPNATPNTPATPTASGNAGSSTTANGKTVGVGAAVALAFVDMTVNAGIGAGRTVIARALDVSAIEQNNLETVSVSGTDPIARSAATNSTEVNGKTVPNTQAKDISVDASVAVGLINNHLKAYVGREKPGYSVTNIQLTAGDLTVLASQNGETKTAASGYAVGASTGSVAV